jgi:hypothetical protein
VSDSANAGHSAPAAGFARRSIDEQVRQACQDLGLSFTIGRSGDGAQRYVINGEPLSPGDAADRYLPGGFAANFGTLGTRHAARPPDHVGPAQAAEGQAGRELSPDLEL